MNKQNHFKQHGISLFIFICLLMSLIATRSFAQEGQSNSEDTKVLELLVIDKVTKEPLPDVSLTIRAYHRTGGERRSQNKTDENGKCKLEIKSPFPYVYRIETSKDGYVPIRVGWGESSAVKEIPNECTLALEKGTTIGCIIQDEDGNPISDASVFILLPSEGQEGIERVAIYDVEFKTDANGLWKCDYAPAKLDDIWIRLEHPDYINDDMFGMTPKPPIEKLRDMTGVMVMKKGLVVKGKVLDTEGQPIRGAKVAQGSDRFGSHYPDTRTDAQGNFSFENAKEGEIILTVQSFRYAPDLKQIIVKKDMEPIEFRLEPGYTIKGRIVDPNGNPVAGAFVAADTWRGHRSLEWRVDTNAEGRFQWRAAPSDEVLMDMGKQGYMSVRGYDMIPSDEEYEIVMPPALKIHGTVVDAETGNIITNYKLIPGIEFASRQTPNWQRDSAKIITDGNYQISFTYPYDYLRVRIEAEGYKPGVSRPFTSDEGNVTFDFKLEKGQGLKGIVKLPDGTIAKGADVILCIPGQGVSLQNGRIQFRREVQSVEVKEDGAFSFSDQEGSYAFLILHDKGYAEISDDEFKTNSEVILQPWAKVEGKLLIGKEPGVGNTILLMYDRDYNEGGINYYNNYQTTTDENGNFTFDRVAPGNPRIARQVRLTENSYTYSHVRSIEVNPGETLQVTIGGTGQKVIGKVHVPDYVEEKIDIPYFSSHLGISSPNNIYKQMSFKIESDGTFSIDDVPTGSYTLSINAYGPATEEMMPHGERIGLVSQSFNISELPGGRTDEPLDLGTLELVITNKEEFIPSLIGRAIPDIADFNLSLKPKDIKDKSVLICFWDFEQRPSRNALMELNKKFEELKSQNIVVLAIQASDTDEKDFNDWLKEYEINILMGMMKTDSTETRFNWGVKALPWLILTDKNHIVTNEGFSVSEIEEKIK